MHIALLVAGTRGDIEPFLSIAKVLLHRDGHRVRLATHAFYRDHVMNEGGGVEFYPLGCLPGSHTVHPSLFLQGARSLADGAAGVRP